MTDRCPLSETCLKIRKYLTSTGEIPISLAGELRVISEDEKLLALAHACISANSLCFLSIDSENMTSSLRQQLKPIQP